MFPWVPALDGLPSKYYFDGDPIRSAGMTSTYFFYGTLCDADVRRAVLGPSVARVTIVPGTLPGWRCVFMRGRVYPVLQPDAHGAAEGVIAEGLDAVQAACLDRFETDEYRARFAQVRAADGRVLAAKVYFAARAGLESTTPWRFAEWQARHKGALLKGWFGRR